MKIDTLKLHTHKCLVVLCEEETVGFFCKEHYLLKEKNYGIYDLRTLHWGLDMRQYKYAIKRVFNYYWFELNKYAYP
jgi:hypothetical protein